MAANQPAPDPADVCAECGERIVMQIVPICRECQARKEHRVWLETERVAWQEYAPKDIALSHGEGRLAHLVMGTDPMRTFCGKRATEPKKKRIRVAFDNLPARCCTDCRDKMEHVRKTAAPLQR